MACTTTSSFLEYEDTKTAQTSGFRKSQEPRYRRRHSSFIPKRHQSSDDALDGEEGVLIKFDLFLQELERRLDFLDNYGNLTLDTSISRAYDTLQAVRARCSQVSEEVIDAGRRRARIMVDTVEATYQDALAAKESLNDKIQEGIEFLDSMLSSTEARAYKMREQGLARATETLMGGGRRVVDEGFGLAHGILDEGMERAKKAAESLDEHIQSAITRAREHGLIRYEDLPIPWRVNPHIVNGYRFSPDLKSCISSMFTLSNETINIISHAGGLAIVLSIAFYFYPWSNLRTNMDIFVAGLFFFAACKCLACSTMWHLFSSVAKQNVMERFACVDYSGISVLIAASIITTEYTAFYCEPLSQLIYVSLSLALGICGISITWLPYFNRADKAWARVAFYCALGASGFAPVLQLCWTRGADWTWNFYLPIAKSILVYVCGAVIYASQIPERWCPGSFDYIGGSHNLWHIAVLGGILFHYKAMTHFFASAYVRAQDGCIAF